MNRAWPRAKSAANTASTTWGWPITRVRMADTRSSRMRASSANEASGDSAGWDRGADMVKLQAGTLKHFEARASAQPSTGLWLAKPRLLAITSWGLTAPDDNKS